MASSPSHLPAPSDPVRKTMHSRHTSSASQTPGDSARPTKHQLPLNVKKPVHYTCIIRLPFCRNGFEDPPPVHWDAVKDKALWKLISQASNSKDLDWEETSSRFDVSLGFLLQQAAWLYERHFESMRAQMKKLGSVSLTAGGMSPVSPAEAAFVSSTANGGVSMQRTGSRESKPPLSSIITAGVREASNLPLPGDAGSSPATPRTAAPSISRTPSSATMTQSKVQGTVYSRPPPIQHGVRGSSGSDRRPAVPALRTTNDPFYEDAIEHEGPFASDSEEESSAFARARALRRAPLAKRQKPAIGKVASDGDTEGDDDDADDDDDDDDSGGYLPFAAQSSQNSKTDPAATLRASPKKPELASRNAVESTAKKAKARASVPPAAAAPGSPTSSASSAVQHQLSSSGTEGAEIVPRPGPLSPRHRAQLASLSPRSRREGSEGSPSMGSSFSDLDDASVTQSAMEDALLSNIRQGNFSSMASRMSSLRDALGR